jgi:hypothetical protein
MATADVRAAPHIHLSTKTDASTLRSCANWENEAKLVAIGDLLERWPDDAG